MQQQKEEEEEGEKQVSWNLSQSIIQEVSELLRLASANFVERKLFDTFSCLKAIKLRITQSLNNEEREFLLSRERTIFKRSCLDKSEGFEVSNPEMHGNNRTQLAILVERYNNRMMDLLQKYGYLIPLKEDIKRVM